MAKKIVLLFCLMGLIVGCEDKPQVQTHKKTFVSSGTYLTVTAFNEKAAGIVHQEFKRLNKIFNIYDPDSELSRLNGTYKEKVKVSDELFELLQLSREVNELTNGAFDVSYGVLFEFWKNLMNEIIESIILLLHSKGVSSNEIKKKFWLHLITISLRGQFI